MSKFKNKLIIKVIRIACSIVAVTTFVSLITGSIIHGRFTVSHVFDSNIIVGAIITAVGIILHIKPVFLDIKRGIVDYSNYAPKFIEQREEKEKNASEIIWIGITIIMIAGLVQLVVSWI